MSLAVHEGLRWLGDKSVSPWHRFPCDVTSADNEGDVRKSGNLGSNPSEASKRIHTANLLIRMNL